jgi:hypothetical protein
MTLHSQNTVIAVKKIWSDKIALTGGTVNAGSITGLTATLKEDFYEGGRMVILDGNQAGKEYRITSNGTDSITVSNPKLTESGNAVVNTDNVALFPYRSVPDADDEWLLIDNAPNFTPTEEYAELFAQRAGALPYRKDSYLKSKTLDTTLDYTFQDAQFLPLCFGKVVDTGSTEGGGLATTLSSATYPGEDEITVASTTNAAENDYIRVDTSTLGEIRKITDIMGSVITLDKPLRRAHASGVSVTEMDDSAVFTHTFTEYYGGVFNQWPFVIKSIYNDPTVGNNLNMYTNYQVTSVSLKNDGDKLVISAGLKGVNFNYDDGYVIGSHDGGDNESALVDSEANFYNAGVRVGMTVNNLTDGSSGTITAVGKTTITASLSGGTDDDWDDDDAYSINVYEEPTALTDSPALYYDSEVSINGTVDGTVRTVSTSVDYGGEYKYYHNDYSEGFPSEVILKRPSHTCDWGVRIQDDKFLDLLENGSKFDSYAKYNLNSAGTHYIKITAKNNRPSSVPHPFPAGGPFDATLNTKNQYFEIEVVDDEPYY